MNNSWFKKNIKCIFAIILYLLYQFNVILLVLEEFGLNINKISKTPRLFIYGITDLVYVVALLLLFKKELIKGVKDLKAHFFKNATLSLECWITGCVIMITSSLIISFIFKQDVAENEKLIREGIKLAPIYMLFTCSIVAPLFEEMIFRRSLRCFIKYKWVYIISSGLIFGLLHVIGSYSSLWDLLYVIPYGAMGSCFAFLYYETDNIVLPITVHMIHNTILVLSQIIGVK